MQEKLLTRLGPQPVQGVSMAGVAVLRLDRLGGSAPGNKHFKLTETLALARRQGLTRLVSFGGAWSNHLHALAALGREQGMSTIGIVRGENGQGDTAMLADVRRWGMEVVRVSRQEYRRRHDPAYLDEIRQRFAPCLVIPEGGASDEGVRGTRAIARLLMASCPQVSRCFIGVGTGTTLAGVVAGLPEHGPEAWGISALRGAADLEARVTQGLASCEERAHPPWRILHDYHCGGFARVSAELREFMLDFEAVHRLPLEPVYTGKAMYAIHCLLREQDQSQRVQWVLIHTGGLQGRRGYDWLSSQEP